jgi:hypothetical protein
VKTLIYLLTAVISLSLATPVYAGAAEAEAKLLQSCIDDKENSSDGCHCVMSGLKRDLHPDSYELFLELFSVAISGDVTEMMRFALSGKIPLEKLEAMGKELEDLSNKLDKECDDVNLIYNADKT